MFRFHVVQAEFGDALLLEYGADGAPHFILIDGGPPGVYDQHLRQVLAGVREKVERLDLAILSHVDNDHVIGMLDYFAELQGSAADLPVPAALWHNAFSDTIDQDGQIAPRLAGLLTANRAMMMPATYAAVNGIGEGRSLRVRARAAGVPINPEIDTGIITVDTMTRPIVFENLSLLVVGPTKANLDALREEWLEWLEKNESKLDEEDPQVLANSDRSVPNLSSIALLASADGRTILLTGDGRGDHLLTGLEASGRLPSGGTMHVDVLKLPHHGSERNITKKFFQRVTADVYVASANGRDGNPDLNTLTWIVETAKADGRPIEIVVTNEPPSVEALVKKFPPKKHGYTLTILPRSRDAHVIELAA